MDHQNKRKSRRLFGTDGIRGKAGSYPIVPELIVQLGRALTHVAKRATGEPTFFIGRDTRASGPMIKKALCDGICQMGGKVHLGGVITTPGVAYCMRQLEATVGISISASHNAYHDNGIKVFWTGGRKLPDAEEASIEEFIIDSEGKVLGPSVFGNDSFTAEKSDPVDMASKAKEDYVEFLINTIDPNPCFSGEKIVVDCANGAGTDVVPAVFERLGANVVAVGNSPDGYNINNGCGALHPEPISKLVKDQGAIMGVALDGDGDRLVVIDEMGQILDGDYIMAICGVDMIERGVLKDNTVVATIMSNLGLDKCIETFGGHVVRTDVGDRYVEEVMSAKGYNLGGEQSGHITFRDYHTTGDGILTAIQLYKVIRHKGQPLSKLKNIFKHYPQFLINVKVQKKVPFHEIPKLASKIKEVETSLGRQGRLIVRYSGTENVVRIMVEGKDEGLIKSLGMEVKETFEKCL